MKQSQASFKIGFSNVNQSLFDLEISERIGNIDSFHAELEKYLQFSGVSKRYNSTKKEDVVKLWCLEVLIAFYDN